MTNQSRDGSLHRLAFAAAVAGADAIRAVTRTGLAPRDKGGIEDLVTSADLASERAILSTIRAERPDDEIVAEESGVHAGHSGIRWYVDPLDGTANLVAGKADYAVSIAVHRDGEPVAAVIYRPADSLWLATREDGLVHGTPPPRLASPRPLSHTCITISRPHDRHRHEIATALREAIRPHIRQEQRIGSAACALFLVATGELDAYVSVDIPPWDTAAGHRLVQLAGGNIRLLELGGGFPVSVAASPVIAERLCDLILCFAAAEASPAGVCE